jgi:hypothetical protein
VIAAVLVDGDERDEAHKNVFQRLNVLRSVGQKVLESVANERPNIARPAREARDRLKVMDDDSLQGLF